MMLLMTLNLLCAVCWRPQFKEVVVGRAEVRQVISTTKGYRSRFYVTEGRITNDSEVRLIRDGIVVFEGKVDSLRRFKDEVKEVKTSLNVVSP